MINRRLYTCDTISGYVGWSHFRQPKLYSRSYAFIDSPSHQIPGRRVVALSTAKVVQQNLSFRRFTITQSSCTRSFYSSAFVLLKQRGVQGRVQMGAPGASRGAIPSRLPPPPPPKKKLSPVVVWRSRVSAPPKQRPVLHSYSRSTVRPSSGRWLLVFRSTDTVHLEGISISVCCLKLNFTMNVSFRRAAASRGSGLTRIMASRAPKRRADDLHCLSSFLRAKIPNRNFETAVPLRITTLVSTRR